MKTIVQSKNLKQDRGNYKIVTGNFYKAITPEGGYRINVANMKSVKNVII